MSTTLSDLASSARSTVGDAWSTGSDRVVDLAATVAGSATDLATAVADHVPDVTDKASDLAHAARRRLPGGKPPRSLSPWAFIAAGIAAFLIVGWWLRRNHSAPSSPAVDTSPVREGTGTAARAASN
ncbi:MAG: hypothetical protein H0U21_10095 [Acidimicrobiia bacterium]|nr:hypothetical protein [Acidimicrobiia bacterium]